MRNTNPKPQIPKNPKSQARKRIFVVPLRVRLRRLKFELGFLGIWIWCLGFLGGLFRRPNYHSAKVAGVG